MPPRRRPWTRDEMIAVMCAWIQDNETLPLMPIKEWSALKKEHPAWHSISRYFPAPNALGKYVSAALRQLAQEGWDQAKVLQQEHQEMLSTAWTRAYEVAQHRRKIRAMQKAPKPLPPATTLADSLLNAALRVVNSESRDNQNTSQRLYAGVEALAKQHGLPW